MQHISKTLEAAQSGYLTNSTRSPGETSKPTALPLNWVSALFKKLQAAYGHKWTAAIDGIEEVAVQEWADGLAGLSGEQIKRGLITWREPWPPSLPEFRAACLGRSAGGKNEHGLDYVPEYLRAPVRVTDRSRVLSSDEREAKRANIAEKIAAMRAALNQGAV